MPANGRLGPSGQAKRIGLKSVLPQEIPHPPAATTGKPPGRLAFARNEALAAIAAVAGEAVVVLQAFAPGASMVSAVSVHAVVMLIVACLLFWNRQPSEDRTISATIWIVIAVAGPAGAIASLAMLPFIGRTGAGPEVLKAWYARLAGAGHSDPATHMYGSVLAGRVVRLDDTMTADFAEVISSGTLAERQAALGLMARKFHTDYAPALEMALRSPEPVVRVQAAAVVARVRAGLKVRIKALLGEANGAGLAGAGELTRLADCSLVDRADRDRCRRGAGDVLSNVLASPEDVALEATAAGGETAHLIERFLLSSGRLKDFRVSRRIHDLISGGHYRVRRARARQEPV